MVIFLKQPLSHEDLTSATTLAVMRWCPPSIPGRCERRLGIEGGWCHFDCLHDSSNFTFECWHFFVLTLWNTNLNCCKNSQVYALCVFFLIFSHKALCTLYKSAHLVCKSSSPPARFPRARFMYVITVLTVLQQVLWHMKNDNINNMASCVI